MSIPKSNEAIVNQSTKRINGIQKYLKKAKVEIPVQGELVKPSRVQAIFQKSLDTRAAVVATHAAYLAALKERDAAEELRAATDENLKAWVLSRFGARSVEANEFGYAARKTPEVSAATRAAAVVQGKATRIARGTVGKKEKLKIKGVVPTSTAPAAPVSTAPAAGTPVPASVFISPAPAATPAPATQAPVASPVSSVAAPVAAPTAIAPAPEVNHVN